MNTEEWRQCPDFPAYAVSEKGQVMRIASRRRGNPSLVLKPAVGRYAAVTLYRDKKPFVCLVHRLVCAAFHGPAPSPKHEVAHGDGVSVNNAATNLRWATRCENEADKILHGTSLSGRASFVPLHRRPYGSKHGRHTKPECTARGEQVGGAKLNISQVLAIRADARRAKAIAADYGVTRALVSMIKANKIWRHV